MENQHRKITGYRELSEAEIDVMNTIKAEGDSVGNLIAMLEEGTLFECDHRWLAIAKTQLQQGFMALTRAVAKPESF